MTTTKHFHPVKATSDGIFNTASGIQINLHNPTEDSLKIWDIAGALSLLCRFGGHVQRFYSVAQHSVLVAALAPADLKREALMHDAAEAYLGDVIKPLKHLIGEPYTLLEDRFETVLAQRFGLDRHALKAVKEYDLMALELEHEALQLRRPISLVATMQRHGLIDEHQRIWWEPMVANIKFLDAFTDYFPEQEVVQPHGTNS